jgi:hypothetical protein
MTEFPLSVYPDSALNFIQTLHNVLHFPIDFFAVPLLSIASAAIGNSRSCAITSDWIEKPIIFTCTVGNPGSAKSPSIGKIIEPIIEIQRQNKIQYDQEMELYEIELDEFEKKKRINKPTKPIFKQLFTSDNNVEGLRNALVSNLRGILVYRQELSAWITSMNQFKGGKGDDRQRWLIFWDGKEPWVWNRASETNQLDNPFVPLCGTIQPEVITELSAENLTKDGLIHRILFGFPESTSYQRPSGEVPPELYENYFKLISSLYQIPVGPPIQFSASARNLLFDWCESNDEETQSESFKPELVGPWAKMRGQLARISHILFEMWTCQDKTPPKILEETYVNMGIRVCEYFKSQCQKTYGLLQSSPLLDQASEVIARAHKRQLKELNSHCILSMKIKGLNKSEQIKPLIQLLEEQGHGISTIGKLGSVKITLKNGK